MDQIASGDMKWHVMGWDEMRWNHMNSSCSCSMPETHQSCDHLVLLGKVKEVGWLLRPNEKAKDERHALHRDQTPNGKLRRRLRLGERAQ